MGENYPYLPNICTNLFLNTDFIQITVLKTIDKTLSVQFVVKKVEGYFTVENMAQSNILETLPGCVAGNARSRRKHSYRRIITNFEVGIYII